MLPYISEPDPGTFGALMVVAALGAVGALAAPAALGGWTALALTCLIEGYDGAWSGRLRRTFRRLSTSFDRLGVQERDIA